MLEAKNMLRSFLLDWGYSSLLPVGLSVFIIVFIYEASVLLAFMCLHSLHNFIGEMLGFVRA